MDKEIVAQGLRYIDLLKTVPCAEQQDISLRTSAWDNLNTVSKREYYGKAEVLIEFIENYNPQWVQ